MEQNGDVAWADVDVPQTNIQLYNLLAANGYSDEEMELVRRVYEVAMQIYSGRYQGDGKPFVAHGLGAAGILANLRMPAALVAAGVVHNAYQNADLGTTAPGPTPTARAYIRANTDDQVEQYVYRFLTRWPGKWSGDVGDLADLSTLDYEVHVLSAAETLEKMTDDGVAYTRKDPAGWLHAARSSAAAMRALDHGQLAQWLDEASERLGEATVADSLKVAERSFVSQAPSLSPRGSLVLRRRARELAGRLRRTAGRQLRKIGLR